MTSPRIDILLKTITLLNRERELDVSSEDNSNDLAKTILETFDTNAKNNQLFGGDASIISDLRYLIKDLITNGDGYDRESLVSSLSIILKDRDVFINVVNKTINVDMDLPSLKRTILTLRSRLTHYYKEFELRRLISKASYAINTGNLGKNSLLEYSKALANNIEALTFTTSKTKDPAIVDEFDIDSEDAIKELFKVFSGENRDTNLLKTSWPAINDMLQGGFRRGSFVAIYALQHNYKSGFIRSILAQLLRCNVPILKDPTKKPLMVYISFEDDTVISIEFLYNYLYYSEFRKLPDMTEVSPAEAASYVKKKLCVTGYNVKILRVNPSEWTHKHIFNKVMQYEADGYEVHAVLVDYLSKLPTTGCIQGPTGTDMRDMFNRVRNYMSSREILFISPHQASSEAKQLLRNGVNPLNFVKEIAGRGYTEGSKQLDQVVDLEILLHKTKLNGKWVLTVQRGKDRRPGIIDDDKMYTILPFPKKAPIPETLESDDISMESITSTESLDELI